MKILISKPKIYKLVKTCSGNMIPGNPKGLPDESFVRMFPSDSKESLDDFSNFSGGVNG